MPTYAYKCKACKREFEREQKFADDPLVKCPYCKKLKLVRLISSSGLVFKGSGFYLTDYKKRSTTESEGTNPPTAEKGEKSEKGGKSERSEKSEDAKPETPVADKGETKSDTKGDSGSEKKPTRKKR
jgi:putative FmdB family regulatory protein